jgi:hypothetical protein
LFLNNQKRGGLAAAQKASPSFEIKILEKLLENQLLPNKQIKNLNASCFNNI